MILYTVMSCVIIRRVTVVPTQCVSAVSTIYHDMSTIYRDIFGPCDGLEGPPRICRQHIMTFHDILVKCHDIPRGSFS